MEPLTQIIIFEIDQVSSFIYSISEHRIMLTFIWSRQNAKAKRILQVLKHFC